MGKMLKKLKRRLPLVREADKRIRAFKKKRQDKKQFKELRGQQTITCEGSQEAFDSFPLHIHWEITKFCNYRCSYCFQAAGGHDNEYCSLEEAKTAIEHLVSANRSSYQFQILGGEPLSHPNVVEIVQMLDDRLGSRIENLRLLTNGSFKKGQLDALIKAASHFTMLMSISVHFEFVKPEKLYSLIEEYSEKTNLEFGLMVHPEHFDTVKETFERLLQLREKHPFFVGVNLLREPPMFVTRDSRYQEEHYAWAEEAQARFDEAAARGPKTSYERIEEVGRKNFIVERKAAGGCERMVCQDISELDRETAANFGGMQCCAGTLVMGILPSGRARGAICRLAPTACNIFEENPFENDAWMRTVPCSRKWCADVKNWRIAKFLSPGDAKAYLAECKEKQAGLLDEFRAQSGEQDALSKS